MYQQFGKRSLDITLSIFLSVALFPLLVVISLLIKIFDPGPVIFKQERAGMNGRSFKFYKFRSMPVNTGDIPSDQLSNIEITWIGKTIRRTNIDELPQLLNILKGDMSIVGPRPSLLSQRDLVEQRICNGAILCRPGLTGLAQISSFDGMTMMEKAQLDGKYAESISFKNDMLIIIKTFGYLLKPPPVY